MRRANVSSLHSSGAADAFPLRLPISLARSPAISPAAKLVLIALCDHRNRQTGQCNPKAQTLAAETGLSEVTVWRRLSELRRCGLIRSARGPRSSAYTIAPEAEWAKLLLLYQTDRAETGSVLSKRQGTPYQIDRTHPPASLLNQTNGTNRESGGGGEDIPNGCSNGRQPSTSPPPPTDLAINGNLRDPLRQTAHALVRDLLPAHPKTNGTPGRAVHAAMEVLAASENWESTAATIRENHPAWCELWRELPPGQFVPYLDLWLSNGDWQFPPPADALTRAKKPPARQHRSMIAEAFDNA